MGLSPETYHNAFGFVKLKQIHTAKENSGNDWDRINDFAKSRKPTFIFHVQAKQCYSLSYNKLLLSKARSKSSLFS